MKSLARFLYTFLVFFKHAPGTNHLMFVRKNITYANFLFRDQASRHDRPSSERSRSPLHDRHPLFNDASAGDRQTDTRVRPSVDRHDAVRPAARGRPVPTGTSDTSLEAGDTGSDLTDRQSSS